jgi:perosamine synthetase
MRLRMIPPKRLDIGWRHFAWASLACLLPHRRDTLERRIEARLGDAVVCLSARSALDLLLQALGLPRGSEVLVSAITIPDVARILELHGLVPVAVDVDPRTLMPRREDLEEVRSDRARAVLVAHLFGSRGDLEPVFSFARRHALFLIEDAAQAFEGPATGRHPAADATMLSFGPIKTATALGGGAILVGDQHLRERIRNLRDAAPTQGTGDLARRVARCSLLKALSSPLVFGTAVSLLGPLGVDIDGFLSRSSRSFRNADLVAAIRRRPSGPLLALLDRRLGRFDPAALRAREALGREVVAALPAGVATPGTEVERHTFWLFPVVVADPQAATRILRSEGFYAMREATRLGIIERPSGARGRLGKARRLLDHLLFVPIDPLDGRTSHARLRAALERAVAPTARGTRLLS